MDATVINSRKSVQELAIQLFQLNLKKLSMNGNPDISVLKVTKTGISTIKKPRVAKLPNLQLAMIKRFVLKRTPPRSAL